MTGIRVQNISQFGGGAIADGFLRTALALSATLQNVTDNAGNPSALSLASGYAQITNLNAVKLGVNGVNNTNTQAVIANDFASQFILEAITSIVAKSFSVYESAGNFVRVGINLAYTTTPSATLDLQGEGSTSATKSGFIKNGSGNTILDLLDDQSILGYSGSVKRFKLGFSSGGQEISTRDGQLSIGLIDANSSAAVRILTTGTGYTYIDGYTEGAALAQNYPLVLGARNSNTGINIVGATTQENGTPIIIGSQIYEPTAILNINSTTRGILFPRMTTAQRNAIGSPANSLTVFDTDLDTICFYSSAAGGWRQVSNSAA